MNRVSLTASGGLNKDVDPNNLPQGDYVSASNIVFDSGKSGGAGALRLLESIRSTGVTFSNIKATTQDVDGTIFVLVDNGSTATVYKVPTTLNSSTALVTYTHLVATTFTPDIKVIGANVVWNYAEEGTVLICPTATALTGTRTILDLKLQKDTPNNVVSIKKNIGTGVDLLESNDYQFASRYHYSSNEYSVLGNYSQMYKGEKGTASYTLSYDFTNKPYFADSIEVYVRIGNNGIWRRIDTQDATATTTFTWSGQTYESLDMVTTGNPYDAVPVNAKHIEIAKNRIFLADVKDDYDVVAANLNFTISADSTGYTLPTGGAANTYISGVGLTSPTSSETTYGGTEYVKPFANNSVYAAGIAFYDSALKTRGVEKNYVKFTTGKFAYPLVPTITVEFKAGWVRPSWAKYAQLVYTKNTSKSYFYEGFASNIYFQINRTETNPTTKETTVVSGVSQSVTTDQIKDIQYFVVDLMGMYRAGRVYSFEEGDRITINTPAPNGLLDMKVHHQENNLVYCLYNGGAMTNLETPDPKLLFFEIYSPKQIQEDESLVFYEYGNLVDITSWGSTTTPLASPLTKTFQGNGTLNSSTTSKLIGDTVFTTLDIPSYLNAPFLYSMEKPVPSKDYVVEDRVTEVYCSMADAAEKITFTADAGYNPFMNTKPKTIDLKLSPKWTSFGTNQDSAVIVDKDGNSASSGPAFKLMGYYEQEEQDADVNQIRIDYKLKLTYALTYDSVDLPDVATGGLVLNITSQLYRIPYDNAKNIYGKVEPFLKPFYGLSTGAGDGTALTSSGTMEISSYQIATMPNDVKEINPNDKFYVEIVASPQLNGDCINAVFTLEKPATGAAVKFTINGDRTTPKTTTSYNNNAKVSTTNTKVLIRSASNATSYPQWYTSAGKPSIITNTLSNPRRTNTIRYGGNYVAGTSINNVNSFYASDSNDVAIENGAITSLQRASRLQGNGSMMLVLCQKESAYIMLGEQELSQGNNSAIRALTANMIGTIRNFGNNLGMLHKESVMNYKGMIWWWDDFNKKIVKYTTDGLTIPSDMYMRSYFLNKSGKATFSFDPFYNMCFVGFGSETVSAGWSDVLQRWVAENYNFRSDFAESYGDKMIIFKGGVMYKPVDNSTTNDYGYLLNASYDGSISFILNSKVPVMPLNVAITHNMNVVDWGQSNGVKSNLLSINITNENGQSTSIVESNFLMEDNRLYAYVLRNELSYRAGLLMSNAIIEGDYIVGYLNKFVVTLKDKTQNMRINSIDVEIAPVSGHS
jgi:hypothetical protein